jgi:hypothetical protein
MPTSYTSLLGLALPVTGELSGTWGDTVNDYITQYLDAAVAGAQTISGSQTAVTLSKTTATSLSQAGSGSTGSSQYQIINCTGNPAGLLTITVPAASKAYLVLNSTSTSQSVKVVGAGPTTGVTMVSGEKALIAWDGSDFVKVASSTADGVTTLSFGTTGLTPNSATAGAITVAGTLVAANGGTGQSSYTTGDLLYATGSTALSKLGIGTNGQILTSTGTAPQWSTLSGVAVTTFSAGTTGFTPSTATSGAVTLAGTLATTNGGTGLTSFTANGVVYASSTSALTTGSALTFDGTTLTNTRNTTDGSAATLTLNNSGATASYATLNLNAGSVNYQQFADAAGNAIGAAGVMFRTTTNHPLVWGVNNAEQMRLTSTGLGIGTSSPGARLHSYNASGAGALILENGANTGVYARWKRPNREYYLALDINNNGGNDFSLYDATAAATRWTVDSSGNLGLGVTPSAWGSQEKAFDLVSTGSAIVGSLAKTGATNAISLSLNAYYNSGWKYVWSGGSFPAMRYDQDSSGHAWYTAPSGTAGNAISFTQAMTLDASGNLGVGTSSPTSSLTVQRASAATTLGLRHTASGNGYGYVFSTTGTTTNDLTISSEFNGSTTERARITAAGFTQPVAYADTVSALGNTGTATTINLLNANVFTATLTGNCTFTLSNPIATGSSSFTLILTNDGTAGRTVAWAGGSFVFPGGASALSRTTTANAVDVWVFFTPNGGTTWYGNIAMKDMKA